MKRLVKIVILLIAATAIIMFCAGKTKAQNSLVANKNWKSTDTPEGVTIRLDLTDNSAKLAWDINGKVEEIESEYVYRKQAQTITLFSENGEEIVFGMKFKDNDQAMELIVDGEHLAYFKEIKTFSLYKQNISQEKQEKPKPTQNEYKSLFNDGSFLDPFLIQYYGTSDVNVINQMIQQKNGYTPSIGSSTSTRPTCTGCLGTGRCRACGGTGRQSHYGYTVNCSCNNGECSSCRGTGKL